MIGKASFTFTSCFAFYIESLILQKRQEGFSYISQEYLLRKFDSFCQQMGINESLITKELVSCYAETLTKLGPAARSAKISAIRQLSLYMLAKGHDAYLPSHYYRVSHTAAHVMSNPEIAAFFEQVDSYHPKLEWESFQRLSMEYRLLFRMILCCGLRVSEARKLKMQDVDLDESLIIIRCSKGQKDRIIYLPEDLCRLCNLYQELMDTVYKVRSEWFFPARETEKSLTNVTIGSRFRQAWHRTSYVAECDKNPTVHSLRHTFVVKRMNLWMEEGTSLNSMMPYLSKHLGHSSVQDTFYYYHQVDSAFRIIREKDKSSLVIIPEVIPNEY